jgi:DNA-binding response OmpR family regulator
MRHILVVDDDLDICRMLTEALEFDGLYRVSCAQSLPEARRKIAADRPDTVVLDIVLPGAWGFDLARELWAEGMPVLLISGSPSMMDDPAADGLACLAKPFRMREFMVWLSEVEGTAALRAAEAGRAPGTRPRGV